MDIAIHLGILFITAVVFGRLSRLIKVPRVAGYLIGGLLAGPQVLGFVSAGTVATLEPLTQFALALIMFDIGTNFKIKRLKRQGKWLLPLIGADLIGTFLLVFVLILVWGGGFTFAILLGILALATAPAATMLVLKEFDARGEVTDSLVTMVGVNNTICIILFEVALAILVALKGNGSFIFTLTEILLSVGAAVVLGIIGGVLIAYLEQKIRGRERLILFLGIVAGVFGACLLLNIPYMLVFLLTGVVLVNVTEYFREIVEELDQVGWPLYVLFFLIAGAKLQLDSLETVGALSIVYLIARSLGKIGGVKLMTKFVRKAPGAAREIGWGLLSQAGVAVGLSMLAVQKLPETGHEIESIIVVTVIFFEIAGTILVRFAVVRAGEVKVFALVDRPMASPYALSLRATARKFLASIGVGPYEKPEHIGRLTVHMVMRKNIRSIPVNAKFPEILTFISHTRYNNVPVTSAEKLYEGMISYPEVREAIYDPSLSYIMIAKDFAKLKEVRIHPGAGLSEALEMFHRLDVDCLPVVEEDSGKLVGLLEQREVLRLCGKRRLGGDR